MHYTIDMSAIPVPLAGIPPSLGTVPTSINQIIWAPARIPTTFTSSVHSGDRAQGEAVGTGMIALPVIIDFSMGNFSLTIQFPRNTFLYGVSITGLIAFTAATAPTVQLGRTAGGAQILAATPLSLVAHSVTNVPVIASLPFPGDAGVLPAWQASLTVAGNAGTSTAGSNLVVIIYGRP